MVRVSARFELAGVRVIGSRLYLRYNPVQQPQHSNEYLNALISNVGARGLM